MIVKNQIKERDIGYWKNLNLNCHKKYVFSIIPKLFLYEKFYETIKIHRLSPDVIVSNLLLKALVLNIGITSYQLLKELAQLLSPLTRSGYTVNSMKDHIVKLKMKSFHKTTTGFNLTWNFFLLPFQQSVPPTKL